MPCLILLCQLYGCYKVQITFTVFIEPDCSPDNPRNWEERGIVEGTIDDLETMGLILEQFLLNCFLRASEKQRKKKTSAKFTND